MTSTTAPAPADCAYHGHWNYYNRGGHRPCGECAACREEAASLQRLTRWVAATAAGANPNR